MKKGKNPTRDQKKLMADTGLDPKKWLVVKIFPDRLEIREKDTGETKELFI